MNTQSCRIITLLLAVRTRHGKRRAHIISHTREQARDTYLLVQTLRITLLSNLQRHLSEDLDEGVSVSLVHGAGSLSVLLVRRNEGGDGDNTGVSEETSGLTYARVCRCAYMCVVAFHCICVSYDCVCVGVVAAFLCPLASNRKRGHNHTRLHVCAWCT